MVHMTIVRRHFKNVVFINFLIEMAEILSVKQELDRNGKRHFYVHFLECMIIHLNIYLI